MFCGQKLLSKQYIKVLIMKLNKLDFIKYKYFYSSKNVILNVKGKL